MNLIEAIKSGKPWREKGGTTWWKFDDRVMIIPHPDVEQVHTGPQYRALTWALEQEYEILEPTVTITRTQFWEAIHSTRMLDTMTKDTGMGGDHAIDLKYHWHHKYGDVADDLEILEPTVTITRSQFEKACLEIWDGRFVSGCVELARKLGLEE